MQEEKLLFNRIWESASIIFLWPSKSANHEKEENCKTQYTPSVSNTLQMKSSWLYMGCNQNILTYQYLSELKENKKEKYGFEKLVWRAPSIVHLVFKSTY